MSPKDRATQLVQTATLPNLWSSVLTLAEQVATQAGLTDSPEDRQVRRHIAGAVWTLKLTSGCIPNFSYGEGEDQEEDED
jgi:hypothetical protein